MGINEEQIRRGVLDQLNRDEAVNASSVAVEVTDGLVTLKGSVPSSYARMAARFDAIVVPGVISVDNKDNKLEVKRPSISPPPLDVEIKRRVESALHRNADIGSSNITVSVDVGCVTLSGYVEKYWQKSRAEELVSNIDGVLEVENLLSLVATDSRIDRQIADDIVSALKGRLGLDTKWVNLVVKDRVVRLSGTLPDWATLQAVQPIAERTCGVREIVNDLITVAF